MFKEILLKILSRDMDKNHSLIHLFDNEEILLTFTRHLTQLMNKLNYLKLEK